MTFRKTKITPLSPRPFREQFEMVTGIRTDENWSINVSWYSSMSGCHSQHVIPVACRGRQVIHSTWSQLLTSAFPLNIYGYWKPSNASLDFIVANSFKKCCITNSLDNIEDCTLLEAKEQEDLKITKASTTLTILIKLSWCLSLI